MSKLLPIVLASTLTLGSIVGLAGAQSTQDTQNTQTTPNAQNAQNVPGNPPPPAGQPQMAGPDCGPDAGDDGPDDCGIAPGDDMGPGDGPSDGWGRMGGREHGWRHHRGERADWGRAGGNDRDRFDGEGRRDGKHGGRMMRIIDANGDGVIGDDEAAALADFAFMRMDRDRDGSLSEAEFVERRGPGRHGGFWMRWLGKDEADAVLKVRKDKFAALDADKNGNLSKTEFFADAKAKLAEADTDKDGKVTPWEFRANLSAMR